MSRHQSFIGIVESSNNVTDSTRLLANTTSTSERIYKGVGATVETGMSLPEQVKAASLDWRVETSPIRYGADFHLVDSEQYRKAIYREDTGELLDTVGKGWQPFQNEQIVDTFNQFAIANELNIERLGSLDKGRCIFAVANLNEQFALSGEDIVTGKILITNYHKSGCGLRIDLMATRLVCSNGMTMPVRIGGKVISHVGGYDEVRVREVLNSAKTNFVEYQEQSQLLAQRPVTDAEAMLLLVNSFGDPLKEIDDQPAMIKTCFSLFKGQGQGASLLSSYDTAWGLLNSVTEYINHQSPTRGGAEVHASSLWLGNKAKKQNQFMQQLVGVCTR